MGLNNPGSCVFVGPLIESTMNNGASATGWDFNPDLPIDLSINCL